MRSRSTTRTSFTSVPRTVLQLNELEARLSRRTLVCRPDHSVQYSSPATNDLYDERFRASLSTGKDLMHYTFGLGLVTSRQLEFNFAGDVTSRSTVISASAIVRFRKAPPKPPDLPPLE